MRWLLLASVAIAASQASATFTGNRCFTTFSGSVQSKCPGHTLPSDRLRNFDRSSHQIECSANSDNYIRRPQKYDFLKWSDLREAGKTQEAFEMRRQLPDIAWKGQIPYETVEVWHWQECAMGTNGFKCGYEKVCQDVPVTRCDSNGKNCRTSYERQCHDEPNTCYYDQDRYEAMHCSNESMDYTARYVRPPESEWNKDSDPYAEFLPNKYDLMPGEMEVVQTYTNSRRSPVLNPYTAVGDAWNKYEFSITGTGAGAQCRPFTKYAINVDINTIKRDTSKPTPNAFKLPVDENGHPMDPISNWIGDAKVNHGQPVRIMLDDSSAAVVKSLAEHSQVNADRIAAQAESGKITNKDGLSNEEAMNKGFFKSTVVKVELVKKNRFWFDRTLGWPIYNDDVQSVEASNNVLSKDQDIMLADKWEIDLMNSKRSAKTTAKPMDLYWKNTFHLAPNRVYALRISMYQRGVPFYEQDCATQPTTLCKIFGRPESWYFSKPMEVRFETSKEWNHRDMNDFFYDGGIGPENLVRHIFEPLVADKPKGGN